MSDTECGDNDEANDSLGDQDGEGSATDEDSEPESENVGSTHEAADDEDDEESSVMVSAAQGVHEAYQEDASSESHHTASGLCSKTIY